MPQQGSDRDIALMMAEVLRKLSQVEARQPEEISQDLRHPFADALRLRVKSRLADAGTLPLTEGLKLFEGGRKLLISAACSAVSPQASYPRKSLKPVEDFIKKCQVGQTAIGSYVASILCPPLAPTAPALFDDLDDPPPFERQVTQSLMSGLAVLSESAQTGDPSLIEKGVEQGVSADLCDALSSITPPEEDAVLQLELSWSPGHPQRSEAVPSLARFAAPDLAFIQTAGKRLRERTVRHDTIEGGIVSLREQPLLIKDLGRTVDLPRQTARTYYRHAAPGCTGEILRGEGHHILRSASIAAPLPLKRRHWPPNEQTPQNAGLCGVFGSGRYRTRICDLHDVNVAL